MSESRGELALEVAPVELPPPAPVPSRAPPLALRAVVSVALLVGLFVVAFGVVLGLVGLNVLVLRTGNQVAALGLFTVLVVVAVGRGLLAMARKPPEPQDEVEVPAAAEPELHARLDDLARKVGTRPPDRVVVTADVNAYVREFGPLMGLLHGRRTLGIGAPLLDVLTVAQLDAVLAHELGHLAGGDTRLGPLAFRTDEAAVQMITSLEQRALAWVFVAYWRFQHRVSAAVRRGQELVADRAAVQVAGRQAAADALHRVAVASAAEDLYRQAFLGPLLEAGCRPPDVGAGLREVLRDPHHVRELSNLALSTGDGDDPWATHPPPVARIARVAALADPPGLVVDQRPASALWRDPDGWSRAAHETWLRLVVGGDLRTVEWEQLGEVTAAPIQRSRAGDVERALATLGVGPGLDGLRQAITGGRGAALAGELIAQGWRAPGADERETILVGAIAAVALRPTLDDGTARFRFSWSEPVRLVGGDGEPLPIYDLARAALAGDWGPLTAALPPPHAPAPDRPQGSRPLEGPPADAPGHVPDGGSPVPEPPCPPFHPSSGGWLWELTLPYQIGRSTRVRIGPDAIALGDAVVGYDQIEGVTVKLERDPNLHLLVKLRPSSGKRLKLGSVAMRSEGQATITTAFAYLLHVLRAAVAPHLRARLVATIEDGGQVTVGGLTLSKAGIDYGRVRRNHLQWDEVVDAVVDGAAVHVILASGRSFERPLASENAFLLQDLIPELRARHG